MVNLTTHTTNVIAEAGTRGKENKHERARDGSWSLCPRGMAQYIKRGMQKTGVHMFRVANQQINE